MLEYVSKMSNSTKKKLGIGFLALALGYFASGGCHKTYVPQKVKNTNAYVITVNSRNTSVLERLGWINNPNLESDYVVLDSESKKQEMKSEMENGKFGTLVLTGHHGSGTDYLYGEGSARYETQSDRLSLSELPKSDDIETVIFSSCTTAGTDSNVVDPVYKPLIGKFPNLKVIVGFTDAAPSHEGVTAAIMDKRHYLIDSSISNFAEKAVSVNSDLVGVAHRSTDGKWYYTDASGKREISGL